MWPATPASSSAPWPGLLHGPAAQGPDQQRRWRPASEPPPSYEPTGTSKAWRVIAKRGGRPTGEGTRKAIPVPSKTFVYACTVGLPRHHAALVETHHDRPLRRPRAGGPRAASCDGAAFRPLRHTRRRASISRSSLSLPAKAAAASRTPAATSRAERPRSPATVCASRSSPKSSAPRRASTTPSE